MDDMARMKKPEESRLINQAICNVMARIGAIEKNKKNVKQGFDYRGVDDVMNALQKELIAEQVYVFPTVLHMDRMERTNATGTVLQYTLLTMQYTFVCAKDGSNVSVTVIGEGMDSGDKSANKAMSVAFKYACLQIFCIPTEEQKDVAMVDPDRDSYDVKNTPKTEQKTAKTSTKKAVPDDVAEACRLRPAVLNGKSLGQLYKDDINAFNQFRQYYGTDEERKACEIIVAYDAARRVVNE